ncbi:MAG: helix-turn-helix transcriptional regulator [Ruminiclostridium sp.]|nr:helix-turn-helix transcriptional regulator [Ruminiclostridium sp.]
MYKNKAKNGRNNICGQKIKQFRDSLPEKTSQRKFAELLQVYNLDIDKNAVQRIESGQRFVTDIELKVIASVLGVSYQQLLDDE